MSQNGWETTIFTGSPDLDRRTVEQQRQAALAQGLELQVQPLQSGGFHVRAVPASSFGHQQSYGGAAAAGMPVVVGGARSMPAVVDTPERVRYIRKVYTLLAISAALAIVAGELAITVGPTTTWTVGHRRIAVPILVAILGSNRIAALAAFGVLFVATLGASAVSRVKGLNVVALFGVATIMGVEIAPMVFIANALSGMGHTLSAAPVRDAFTLTGAIFVGVTMYVYITRKDFSYLYAGLSMGFWVVLGASLLGMFFHSEIFSLAIASVGALVAAGFLLFTTSRIFRANRFDDAVGDALGLIVQLRNLFMFILRILMSSRR